MADAALSVAIENVGNFLIQKGKFLSGVRDEVEEMQIELEWMQCFLKDAERRKGESHRVRNWVTEIRKATYDVEDVVERFVLKSALRNQKGVMNRIKKYAFFISHIVELHQVGSRIEAIKAKLSKLTKRLQIYGIKELRVGGEEAAASGSRRKRQDYAHVVDHNVVGLDEKITELVQWLIHDKEASAVCLYGMGGLGKTTTAKKVYNDSRIRSYFKGFAWVYISQQFSPRQVWESILIQISNKKKKETEEMTDDELTSQLCDIQKERMCLIIMDDIWSSPDWVKLSLAFTNLEGGSRSKILLTSRNQSVATNGMCSISLDTLNPGNSSQLLQKTILSLGGSHQLLSEMVSKDKYVEETVKQCGGLPLAIVVLGGILATKHELGEWERVCDNIKLVLKRGEQNGIQGVNSVLESSYEDLPYNLKSCFLYLSQYREDVEIEVTDLIQKWIGEGFIPSLMEGDETMEDVAKGYLNEMVNRCMVQVGKRSHTGRVKTCRMHDLMRDLCISKAKEESFVHTVDLGVKNEVTISENASIRRLYISFPDYRNRQKVGRSMLSSIENISSQLRSLVFPSSHDELGLIIKKLKLVRVLELLPSPIPYSTIQMSRGHREHIGYLIHVRFLNLRYVDKLPTSIGNLRCLQTLKLENCDSDLKIPNSIWGMEQLRHLYLPEGGGVCESNNQRVSNLPNLQTLVNFPPEKFDTQQNLVKFTGVRKLTTSRYWEEKDWIMLRGQEIVFNKLHSLNSIESRYDRSVDLEGITRGCPCLYRLIVKGYGDVTAFSSIWPSNLSKLVLEHTQLDERHMGPLAKLQSLKVLFLERQSFIGKEMVFQRNDFPKLHHLKLQSLLGLESWRVHEGALPSLVCLEIEWCRKLESVGDGSQFLKQLKEVTVEGMPYSFKRRVEQDWVRVTHDVPSISFSIIYPDHRLEELEKDARMAFQQGRMPIQQGPNPPPRSKRSRWTSYFASKMSIPNIFDEPDTEEDKSDDEIEAEAEAEK